MVSNSGDHCEAILVAATLQRIYSEPPRQCCQLCVLLFGGGPKDHSCAARLAPGRQEARLPEGTDEGARLAGRGYLWRHARTLCTTVLASEFSTSGRHRYDVVHLADSPLDALPIHTSSPRLLPVQAGTRLLLSRFLRAAVRCFPTAASGTRACRAQAHPSRCVTVLRCGKYLSSYLLHIAVTGFSDVICS